MVQIIPARQSENDSLRQGVQGFGQNLMSSYAKEKERAKQMQQEQASNRAFADLFGEEAAGLSPDMKKEYLKHAMTGQNQRMAQELKEGKKGPNEKVQNAYNGLVGLLNKGNLGQGSGITSFFGGQTAKDTGEFKSLTGALEAELVEMVSKNRLSDTRFKYITETLLPKPTDTQDEIAGKLKGIAQLLELDDSVLTGKKSSGGGKRSLASFGE